MNNINDNKLIPASTVLIIRNCTSGIEVFMVVRHHQIDFASGALVFPGGKVEEGETPEKALIREVKEELNIDINNKCIAPLSFSEFDYNNFQLLLLLYICRRWDGEPMSMENNRLEWVKPNMLRDYKMPPADDSLIYCLQDLF